MFSMCIPVFIPMSIPNSVTFALYLPFVPTTYASLNENKRKKRNKEIALIIFENETHCFGSHFFYVEFEFFERFFWK